MIGRLRGEIADKTMETVLLDVGGVGYQVFVPLLDLDGLPPIGDEATLYIHTHVREDAIVLFGFGSAGARKLFERMIGVTGVGPKLAMSALSVMRPAELQAAIIAGDVTALSRISGVGRKTAQRLALELGERVAALDLGGGLPGATPPAGRETLDDLRLALQGLGYPPKSIDRVIDEISPAASAGAGVEALLRDALALLRS